MTIQQLSQETGIGVDTLRIWERRYGFPVPGRDGRGHRRYSIEHVEELRLVKKLQSAGHRPGKIFSWSPVQRRRALEEMLDLEPPGDFDLLQLVGEMNPTEINLEMSDQLQKLGVSAFIDRFALPLIQALDRGWTEGNISIAREHLLSDCLESLLRRQLAAGQGGDRKAQILFLTLSGERHKLGLLLAAVLFQQQGVAGLLLQEELPLSEVPHLAAELGVVAVALSFSSHYSTRQAKQDLAALRNSLNPEIKVIAGGAAVSSGVNLPNVAICRSLEQIPELSKKLFTER